VLVSRACAGDDTALNELLKRHGAYVRRSLSGKIPAALQAVLSDDDILQQTYADAIRDIHRFNPDGPASFRNWLCRLARYNLVDALRMLRAQKRGGGRDRPLDPTSSMGSLWLQVTAPTKTPSGIVMSVEESVRLDEAIGRLPEAYQTAIRLYDLEGLSIETVAASLERSPGAVHMLRVRAFDQIRRHLGS